MSFTPSTPLIVVVSALGAQGASVVSAYLQSSDYQIRALTSDPSCDAAVRLAAKNSRVTVVGVDLSSLESVVAAFHGASFIFAQTVFRPDTFASQGPAAAQALEARHGLNIAEAASKIPSLQHLIWSTLPDAFGVSQGKYNIPHFQAKIPAEQYLRNPDNGLADKTTYLHVGLYGSNAERWPYLPVYVKGAQKYVITLPCSPNALIPFVGDESVNVGLIVQAILSQPEKTLGKSVLGASEYLSCTDWALALSKALKDNVTFAETTLESYEAVWGIAGTEVGLMFRYFNEVQRDAISVPAIITPAELGVQESLRSTEQRLQGMDWRDILIQTS
ncbi:hypothetical protein UA08_06718 [Talaromyces atroroseus]|uniref:NmrA-like domain-containing protein n=1 Tax=Talaromyces atroroseus TaxID=1441469 RepID=A0A225AUJ9_TALAT|nr:hypothetical protein UA08_06718 [Talaromyces atroroseus]OKL58095.1 hypothetical protein UA08_06718 [Talaromyces atroroseus]